MATWRAGMLWRCALDDSALEDLFDCILDKGVSLDSAGVLAIACSGPDAAMTHVSLVSIETNTHRYAQRAKHLPYERLQNKVAAP